MKTQNIERSRLTPGRAEALIPALDALTTGLLLVVVRPLAFLPIGSGPIIPGLADPFTLTRIMAGVVFALAVLVWSHRAGHYDRRRPASI